MKVLVITNRVPYPSNDGGNIATMQMLESMLHCGFEVKLLSLNTVKHFVDTSKLPDVFKTLSLETTTLDTAVKLWGAILNLFSNKSYNAIRFYCDDFRDLIIQTIQEQKYDIVHFENVYSAIYLDYIKPYTEAKFVLRTHNVEYEIWERAALEEGFLKRLYIQTLAKSLKRYEIQIWEKCHAIIPITAIDEAIIKPYIENTTPSLTLPTAIDVRNIQIDTNNKGDHNIYHLGSMNWIPNQQAMEWFMQYVWPPVELATKAHFYMAGRDMPDQFYNYQSERVHIIGEVDNASEFIRGKQIMVVPLFAGSGVRIKILEGMAAAKTIITTSLGVQGIEAFDQEQVLIANNAKSFTEALIWCLKNERKCVELGKKARTLMEEKYSIENFELLLKQFYLKLTQTQN